MKTLLTSTFAALLALSLLAPAQATSNIYIRVEQIPGDVSATAAALEDMRTPDNEQAIARLLPAIQKIREAANRMQKSCEDPTVDGILADCAQTILMESILDSSAQRNQGYGLIDVFARALNNGSQTRAESTHIKTAKLYGKKCGTEMAPETGTEKMIIAILIGLAQQIQADGLGTPKTLDPIIHAIGVAEEIDPQEQSSRVTADYDLKFFKGAGNK